MNPKISQLEALYWAGKLGSFQAAARRLHTTQSAISKRIAELESALGHMLFDRSRRRAQLTPAGERVVAGAERMLAIAEELSAHADDAGQDEGLFRLAATELIAATWLPKLMHKVRSSHPRLRLEIEVHNGNYILEQLHQGGYDLALLPGPMWGRIYQSVLLDTLERAWMASPKMRIPRRTLTIAELSEYPIALQYPDTIHAQLQRAWFHRAGFPHKYTMLVHSVIVLGELACAGVAVAHLPVGFYAPELRRKELVRIAVTPTLADAQYFAVYPRGSPHRLAGEIAAAARDCCDFRLRRLKT